MFARTLFLWFTAAIVWLALDPSNQVLVAADLDDLQQEGPITTITADSITIAAVQSGDELTFVVNAATRITRNGKPVLLRSIQSGEIARISARKVNERRMAATIVVKTP
jgi:hypothetical protein